MTGDIEPEHLTQVVDIGANPIGIPPPYQPLLEAERCQVTGFEITKPAMNALQARKGELETYLLYAIGDGRTRTIYFCYAPGMTSLLEPDPKQLALFPGFEKHGRVNAKGRPMPGEPKDLLYHYSKNEAVMKVLGSDLYPQNSLNAKLPTFIKKVTPTYGHYLTDTDMWFVRSDKEAANPGFHLVYNARPTFLPISESMNPDLIMGKRGRMAFVVGCIHGRGWYSNAGA